MAEDETDFEAEIRAATVARATSCTVCDWLEGRDDAERWDRILAGPTSLYGHVAIYTSMKARGYQAGSCKPIEGHRKNLHRVG